MLKISGSWLSGCVLAVLLSACGAEDADGDGFTVADGDCDDFAASVNPGATETAYNGVDDDCDATTPDDDLDGDGAPAARDCDDSNPAIGPDAEEICNDIDDDCDGSVDGDATDASPWYYDADGDGFGGTLEELACTSPGERYLPTSDDCDDLDDDVYPGAPEICDSEDNDCDDLVDADDADFDPNLLGTWFADTDKDGFGDATNPTQACQAPPGTVEDDTDCDDGSASVNPGAVERCNDIDDNCDVEVDNGAVDALVWYQDIDEDGYGDARFSVMECDQPAGYVSSSTDCAPLVNAVNPGASEVCNAIDDDCDGDIDDADGDLDKGTGVTYHADMDTDGFGDPGTAEGFCQQPAGYVLDGTDCDDTSAARHPDATEVCDDANVDEDCDTLADDADDSVDRSTWSDFYADSDGDTFGDPGASAQACDVPSGYVADDQDCDDSNALINPNATEVCDDADVDEDCNSLSDDADSGVEPESMSTYYEDADGDTYGNRDRVTSACDVPDGHVADLTDCDDTNASVNPAATEVCDDADVDEDCDTLADDADDSVDAATFVTTYADTDGDRYGDLASTQASCDPADGFVLDSTDCDDTNPDVHPGATEVCDDGDVDEDCDTLADDADDSVDATSQTSYFADADADTYGDASVQVDRCEPPTGFVTDDTDCDDGNAAINPGATEVCDADDVDEDCDTLADDADDSVDVTSFSTFFEDLDSDTFGNDDVTQQTCDVPTGYVAVGGDCDDADGFVHPEATEVCDEADVDEDCDTLSDDADDSVDAAGFTTFFADGDGDGFGDALDTLASCDVPAGYVTDDTDCNDADAAVNPSATEVCNTIDDDCDTLSDDDDDSVDSTTFTTFYADTDGDGFGDAASTADACEVPAGYVVSDTDCDDAAAQAFPGAAETDSTTECMLDADEDGYGDENATAPVVVGTDCDDAAAGTNPGATDTPQDGTDQDCSGTDAPYALSDLAVGDLIITEIMKDPDVVADADGEWFELHNASGGEVDLDGLYVEDLGSDSFTVSGTVLVADGDYVVFGVNDDTTTNGEVPVDVVYSGMDLDEASDEIAVYVASGGTLIDEVEYDDVDFPSTAGESLNLGPTTIDATDNDTGANWCEGTSTIGTAGDLGTPGSANDSC